jgi:hypothetical protein
MNKPSLRFDPLTPVDILEFDPHLAEDKLPDQLDQGNPDGYYVERYAVGRQRRSRTDPSYRSPDRQQLMPDDFSSLSDCLEAMLPATDVQQ